MEEKLNRVGKNEKAEQEGLLEKKRSQVEELNKYLDEARENSEKLDKALEKQDEAYKEKQSITEAKQKDIELQQEFNAKVMEYRNILQDIKNIEEDYKAGKLTKDEATGAIDAKAEQGRQLKAQIDELNNQAGKVGTLGRSIDKVTQNLKDVGRESEKAKTKIEKFAGAKKSIEELSVSFFDMVKGLVSVQAMRTVRETFRDGLKYVRDYYDGLNEVRIVTGKTEEEALRLGETFRQFSERNNVSSRETIGAAVEFYRQGLNDTQVQDRMESTIKYSKIAKINMTQAAELITAAVNSFEAMGVSAQKAVDVFSYLGDASASGADEVGLAMQRVAGSAREFGLSFEWLGSYIATLSEKTRLAPERIGTALNSMLARLHVIKEKGFNEEDDTKLNDVAKALDNIGVSLLDNDGNWRAYSDILNDVALKWNGLNDRMKSYIATTMAGTRQQSFFLTLMNDLSLQTEGASRAVELYQGALQSAGSAEEKYAIYKEGIEAAQERLNIQLEKFYSLLKADVLKSAYGLMANIINVFRQGTDIMNGMNIKIPLIVGGITTVLGIFIKLKGVIKSLIEIKTAGGVFAMLTSGKTVIAIMAILTALTALTGWLGKTTTKLTEVSGEFAKLNDEIERINNKNDAKQQEIDNLIERYKALSEKTYLTIDEQKQYKLLTEEISKVSGDAERAISGESRAFENQKEVLKALNDEKERHNRLNAAEKIKTIKQSLGEITSFDNLEFGKKRNSFGGHLRSDIAKNEVEKILVTSPEIQDIIRDYKGNERANKVWEVFNDRDKIINLMSQDFINSHSGTFEADKKAQAYDDIVKAFWKVAYEAKPYDPKIDGQSTESVLAMLKDLEQDRAEYDNMIGNFWDNIYELFESQLAYDVSDGKINEDTAIIRKAAFRKEFTKERVDKAYQDREIKDLIEQAQYFTVENEGDIQQAIKNYKKALKDGRTNAAKEIAEDIKKNYQIDIELEFKVSNLNKASQDLYRQIVQSVVDIKNRLNEKGVTKNIPSMSFEGIQTPSEAIGKIFGRISKNENLDENALMLGSDLKEMAEQYPRLFEMVQEKYGATLQEMVNNPLLMKIFSPPENIDEEGLDNYFNQIKDFMSLKTEESENSLMNTLLGLGNEETEEAAKEKVGSLLSLFSGTNVLSTFTKNLGDEGTALLDVLNDFVNGSATLEEVIKAVQEANENFNLNKMIDAMIKANPELKAFEQNLRAVAQASLNKDIIGTHAEYSKVTNGIDRVIANVKALNTVRDSSLRNIEAYNTALKQLESSYGEGVVAGENYAYVESLIAAEANNAISPLDALTGAAFSAGNVDMNMTWGELLKVENQALNAQPALASLKNMLLNLEGKYGVTIDIDTKLSALASMLLPQVLKFGGKLQNKKTNDTKPQTPKRRGGGGGGGSRKSEYYSIVKEQLDMMSKQAKFDDYYLGQVQSAIERYKKRGEYTNAITGTRQEIDVRKQNNQVLEQNISRIKTMLAQKEAEISGLNRATEEYKHAYDEINSLQDAMMNYTKKLQDNSDAMEELERNIAEYRKAIRQKQMDVENMILQAIMDREERRKKTLSGTIAMEKLILDIIKKRYEKERDEILETQKLKRKAYEEEKRKIDELLQARKDAEKEQDKKKQLETLEGQLVRISADPTRQKEKIALEKKIKALRDEMAWDSAEKQAKAQKDGIDQQIKSLDDYVEYVEKYYEELFKHPDKLIEEMKKVMQKTDDEIIAWLQANFAEWNTYTDNMKAQTIESWKEMLRDMRGEMKLYWDEVYSIIAQGDQAILNFLKENSEEYRKASKLGAEAMYEEWKDKIKAVHDAFKDMAETINKTYFKVHLPSLPSNGNSGGGGGGGGGGGNNNSNSKTNYVYTTSPTIANETEAYVKKNNLYHPIYNPNPKKKEQPKRNKKGNIVLKIGKKYASGGIADYTGLAWLDGSKHKPERVLSPEQTQDFHSLLQGINEIKRFNLPNPLGIGNNLNKANGDSGTLNIDGGVNVYVKELAKDADYNEMAKRVKESIYKEISRTKPNGSIFG